jgi:hypothetical protein
MVADFCELHGWHGYFVAANTPVDDLLRMTADKLPQLIGLSLSIELNLPKLVQTLDAIRNRHSGTQVIIGGQALLRAGYEIASRYPNVRHVPSLDDLEKVLDEE